jgi:hypothetical protein
MSNVLQIFFITTAGSPPNLMYQFLLYHDRLTSLDLLFMIGSLDKLPTWAALGRPGPPVNACLPWQNSWKGWPPILKFLRGQLRENPSNK